MDTKYIICYTGGTCGDLVTAMLDPTDVEINRTTVAHTSERSRLKKPHLFDNNEQKDQYLAQTFGVYNSIPSHDLDYHVDRGHRFVSVVVDDFSVAQWAANRFKNLHRPHVWEEMNRVCGAKTVDDYAMIMLHYSNKVKTHTTAVINLSDIVNGQAVGVLEKLTGSTVNNRGQEIYKQWLECNERV